MQPHTVPDTNEWRTKIVDLGAYTGFTEVRLAFGIVRSARLNEDNYLYDTIYLDNINISEVPVAASFHVVPDSVCVGAALSFNNTTTGANAYHWLLPGASPDSSLQANLQNVHYNQAGVYPVTLIAKYGVVSDTAYGTVSVLSVPLLDLNTDTAICLGNAVSLSAGGATTYNWLPSTGLSANNIPNPVAAPRNSTQYVVTGTNVYGCMASDTIIISIKNNLLFYPGYDSTICNGAYINLTPAAGFAQYLWSTGDTSENLLVDTAGVYRLSTTDAQGCVMRDTFNVAVRICTGVLNLTNDDALTIYPNPASDKFTVLLQGPAMGKISLQVFDATGSCVYTQHTFKTGSSLSLSVNAKALSDGVYVVKLVSDLETLNQALVITKR